MEDVIKTKTQTECLEILLCLDDMFGVGEEHHEDPGELARSLEKIRDRAQEMLTALKDDHGEDVAGTW